MVLTNNRLSQHISEFNTKVIIDDRFLSEKIISWTLFVPSLLTIGTIVKLVFGGSNSDRKRTVTDIYVILKLVFAFLALRNGWYLSDKGTVNLIFILVVWFTIETIDYNLLQILCNKQSVQIGSFKRNLFLSFVNYLEIIFNFSTFYAAFHLLRNAGAMNIDPKYSFVDYIYFSIGSGGIIGYGDYRVYTDAGKTLVIVQGILLLMFFSLFVSYNINLLNVSKKNE